MTTAIAPSSEISTPNMGSGRDDGNVRVAALTTEFISFTVADEQYGVDIMVVREIKDWSAITRLPHQSDYMRGVLNLRGVIVPIIDLRCRFGNGLTDATPMHASGAGKAIRSRRRPHRDDECHRRQGPGRLGRRGCSSGRQTLRRVACGAGRQLADPGDA